MIEKNLIGHLVTNNGLPVGETWYKLGIKFGVKPWDKSRAEEDEDYKIESIRKRTQKVWQRYLREKNSLQLVRETYKEGDLSTEVYAKRPPEVEYNPDEYDIERLTTNPNGGVWLKMKKKEALYNEEHHESLKEILIKCIKPVEQKKPKTRNNKALFIYGSDKHIGALTKDNSVYTNRYDKKEIKKRLVTYVINEIEKWTSEFGPVDSLYIFDLGDALDGFNQKTTGGNRGTSLHTLPQQFNNREQHDIYVELHKELFDTINSNLYAHKIYFVATSDSNHGGDFEYGAMRNLETYLNVKYPFIQTIVSYKPYNHFIFGQHCIIFGHGKDSEDMKNGLPLVLNEKVENYIADYIRVNDLEKYCITFVSGDLHQSAETYAKNFRYKKVLSQYGSSKWMHTNFGSGGAGLSSEMISKDSSRIFKTDKFFDVEALSNTGIEFKIVPS